MVSLIFLLLFYFYFIICHSNFYYFFSSAFWGLICSFVFWFLKVEAEVSNVRTSFFSNIGFCVINFLISTDLVATHKFWYVSFPLSFSLKYILISLLIFFFDPFNYLEACYLVSNICGFSRDISVINL